jgi:hypothetical protein
MQALTPCIRISRAISGALKYRVAGLAARVKVGFEVMEIYSVRGFARLKQVCRSLAINQIGKSVLFCCKIGVLINLIIFLPLWMNLTKA